MKVHRKCLQFSCILRQRIFVFVGCNKIKCDKCSVHDNRNLSDACVWYRVTSCPSVLVLHIKRFAQFGLRFRKLNTFVTIQPVLDMAPFCSPDCPTESRSSPKGGTGGGGSRILYRLYGVVEHVGSLHSGISQAKFEWERIFCGYELSYIVSNHILRVGAIG